MYIMRAFSEDKLQIKQFMPVNSIPFTVKRLDLSWTFFSHIRPKILDYRQTWGQYPPPLRIYRQVKHVQISQWSKYRKFILRSGGSSIIHFLHSMLHIFCYHFDVQCPSFKLAGGCWALAALLFIVQGFPWANTNRVSEHSF